MRRKEFYDRVAEILNVPHEYSTLNDVLFKRNRETGQLCGTNANRFGGREPGNGRYNGVGLIRHYGAIIHVSLNNPKLIKTFTSEDACFKFLEDFVKHNHEDILYWKAVKLAIHVLDGGSFRMVREVQELEHAVLEKSWQERQAFYNTEPLDLAAEMLDVTTTSKQQADYNSQIERLVAEA